MYHGGVFVGYLGNAAVTSGPSEHRRSLRVCQPIVGMLLITPPVELNCMKLFSTEIRLLALQAGGSKQQRFVLCPRAAAVLQLLVWCRPEHSLMLR